MRVRRQVRQRVVRGVERKRGGGMVGVQWVVTEWKMLGDFVSFLA